MTRLFSIGVVLWLLFGLVRVSFAYQNSDIGDPVESSGGGFVSPATADLDMAGYDLLSPGAQTFCNTGKTECWTMNVEVDGFEVADGVGTGPGNIALQTNGRLEFNGAGSTSYMTSIGPSALHLYMQNALIAQWSNFGVVYLNNIYFYLGSGFNYWHRYNSTSTVYEFASTDIDGIGTNGNIFSILDGTDDLELYGNLLHNTGPNFGLGTDGRLTLTQNDDSTGVTLDFNTADTLSLLDQAGTGAADLVLQTTGRLVFNGAGGNTRLEADGTGLSLDTYAANTLVLRHASTLHTFYVNSRHQKFASPVDIELWRNDPSPTANDKIADINFRAYSDGPVLKDWGAIRAYQATVTDTDEDLKLDFDVIDDGSEVTYLTLDATDGSEGVHVGTGLNLSLTDTAELKFDGASGNEVIRGNSGTIEIDTAGTTRMYVMDSAVDFDVGVQHDTQTNTSPTAPVTCGVLTKGHTQIVDDSDDGAGTEMCYCGMTDDSTYDWLQFDGTACSFY